MAEDWNDTLQNVLNRMKRNHDRGVGIYLSADELDALSITIIGSVWEEEDPRKKLP